MDRAEGPAVNRSEPVDLVIDGRPVRAWAGQSVAAVLMARGRAGFSRDPKTGRVRGIFCGIGQCHECLVRIDDQDRVRACQTLIAPGMIVETGSEAGS